MMISYFLSLVLIFTYPFDLNIDLSYSIPYLTSKLGAIRTWNKGIVMWGQWICLRSWHMRMLLPRLLPKVLSSLLFLLLLLLLLGSSLGQ